MGVLSVNLYSCGESCMCAYVIMWAWHWCMCACVFNSCIQTCWWWICSHVVVSRSM